MHTRHIPAALVTLAAAGAVLAGCGGSDTTTTDTPVSGAAVAPSSTSAAAPEAFGDADVAFVQGMIPHHEQAVEMAELAPGRTDNEQVLTLASDVATAQRPEIDQLTGFLRTWGVDPSAAPPADGDMGGMDHGGTGGMMTDADLATLGTLSGAEFDRQWLSMMIAHHEGAIEMAETERTDGENPDARALAEQIVSSQRDEIGRMAALLPQG